MTDKIQIVYLQGDGVAQDIWNASHEALEEAVIRAYNGEKRIEWIRLIAGIEALEKQGRLLPEETISEIRERKVAIKGPLTTPVGGGFRSINVYLRQIFDLYVCLRPVRYFEGLPSPLKKPHRVDFVILRENTEDLYKGIEWEAGTDEVMEIINFLRERTETPIPDDSGIGIKPISRDNTRRFVRWAIEYALKNRRRVITVVHKGNIMKYTEGAFRKWAYELAEEYMDRLSFRENGEKIIFNDRIADNMFMQAILRPEEYDVLVCPNLNGDYLSDACAALIGGLGVAPGANIGDEIAIFEPTHGSAPKYAGKDMVNPASFLLSGGMMLAHVGLDEASRLLTAAIEATVREGVMTYDLARQIDGVIPVSCSVFGNEVTKRIGKTQ
ncbi:MAG: Isocitrate dehydrogenase (NADP) [Syntrophorhabdaceae bacterium PtaU1.Bin034]|nr:MAG: Isocitrate dehydrogenase (NADP) [Syntrophorhabdaceae bacterium PtaU1.Bin034]